MFNRTHSPAAKATGNSPAPGFWQRLFGPKPLRHVLVLLLILAFCAALFLWAGYTFLPKASQTARRQIVNDSYDTLTQPLAAGGEICQTIELKGRLYGVVLDVTTYGRVAHGTLHVRLLGADGREVAACDTDMTQLLDNTFHWFVFNQKVQAPAAEPQTYTLVLTSTPQTADDVLGFHRSSGPAQNYVNEDSPLDEAGTPQPIYPLDGFSLSENGQPQSGTLALQYITQYAGGSQSFIYTAYSFFAALLCVGALGLYVLLFMLHAPLHRVFVWCSIVLGMVFIFLIPPRTKPDEYTHMATAYNYSNRLMGYTDEAYYQGGRVAVRESEKELNLRRYDFDATDIFAYQYMAEDLSGQGGEYPVIHTVHTDAVPVQGSAGTLYLIPGNVVRVFPLMYTASTLGVTLARLLGLGCTGLLFLGSLGNLLLYTTLVALAIRRTPVGKVFFCCMGLLPSCLQLAASFSYDAYVIALALYFTAQCLHYAFTPAPMGIKQAVFLAVLAALLAPAKAVYVVLVLLVLLIPRSRFTSRKAAALTKGAVIVAALMAWAMFNAMWLPSAIGSAPALSAGEAAAAEEAVSVSAPPGFYATELDRITAQNTAADVARQSDPNFYYTITYMLGHIPQTIRLLLRSIWQQSSLWLQGLLGGRLGEIIAIKLEANWLFVIGFLGVLTAAALPCTAKKEPALRPYQRVLSGGVFVLVLGITLAVCLTWTPLSYEYLFGMQGRYLLPALPALMLALRGQNLHFTKPAARPLCMAAFVLCFLCQLDVFSQIILR